MLQLITICIFKLKVLLACCVIKVCKYNGVQSQRKLPLLHDYQMKLQAQYGKMHAEQVESLPE